MLLYILSWYRPIGWVEAALVISFINTSYGRVNVRSGQLGIGVAVLLLSAFILAQKRHDFAAGVFLGAVALKPSFLPFFLLYYLLKKKYRLLWVAGLSGLLMTVLPLLLTGRSVLDLQSMWANLVGFSHVGGSNDPSPSNFYSAYLHHLEPLVYRLLNAFSPFTHLIAVAVIVLLMAFATYLVYRTRDANGKADCWLDFALFSGLSLLAVYH
ncbi:MAG: DUF2029 domain-containing protein, partial [Chloroflexi bacterium]|nr:DUF2029 domain-containing protein [Chloroflexota bacterium]